MNKAIIFLFFFSLTSPGLAAQKCQLEYEKLRKIQKKMNEGYKDSGNSLREKERKARAAYQDCRQGKTRKKQKHKKNKKN